MEQLDLSVRQRDDFVAAFTHELKTPITSMMGYASLLRAGELPPEQRKKAADYIYHETKRLEALSLKLLVMMAVATSIDALAVGITFAFLQMDILPSAAVIGLTTFVISFGGVCAGNRFGARYKRKAEIVGGVVLVLIGVKILLEHLGVIAF